MEEDTKTIEKCVNVLDCASPKFEPCFIYESNSIKIKRLEIRHQPYLHMTAPGQNPGDLHAVNINNISSIYFEQPGYAPDCTHTKAWGFRYIACETEYGIPIGTTIAVYMNDTLMQTRTYATATSHGSNMACIVDLMYIGTMTTQPNLYTRLIPPNQSDSWTTLANEYLVDRFEGYKMKVVITTP
jgi:hypothetical protein